MCVLCRPPSPVPAPKATQRVLVILFPHNVAFGPLLPFPSPPCPAPLFLLGDLGNMVPHPAVASQSPVFSCYRSVRVLGVPEGGGETTTYACPGLRPAGVWSTTTTGCLFLFLAPLWPFLFVFPRVNNDQLGIRLPAIIVGSS